MLWHEFDGMDNGGQTKLGSAKSGFYCIMKFLSGPSYSHPNRNHHPSHQNSERPWWQGKKNQGTDGSDTEKIQLRSEWDDFLYSIFI